MFPMVWSYYVVAILVGIGAGVIWTGQGIYLAHNSYESTVSRNSGLFWALFQVRLVLQIDTNDYRFCFLLKIVY